MTDSRQAAATLTVSRGPGAGTRFDIGAAPVTIGRQAQCEIQVQDTWVSRRHARIAWTGTEYIVEDLGSTNGTFVNNERVGGPCALKSGDLLRLGEQVELGFQMRMSAPVHEEPALPGMAPSPISSAGPSQAQAPPPKPKRRRMWVWALALLGLLVIIAAGVGAYYLLSDNGQRVADLPILEAVLPEPTLTPTPIPPTPTPTQTPTPIPPTATPTPEPLVIKGEAFEADVQDTCSSTDVAITEVVGDGLRIEVLSGSIAIREGGLTVWCYGAKHTWIGSLTYGGYTFDSDENSPLQFILDQRDGYTYIAGKGSVTQPDGKIVELP